VRALERNQVSMDVVFLLAIAGFLVITLAMVAGCSALEKKK
jgi:hypothetical protein